MKNSLIASADRHPVPHSERSRANQTRCRSLSAASFFVLVSASTAALGCGAPPHPSIERGLATALEIGHGASGLCNRPTEALALVHVEETSQTIIEGMPQPHRRYVLGSANARGVDPQGRVCVGTVAYTRSERFETDLAHSYGLGQWRLQNIRAVVGTPAVSGPVADLSDGWGPVTTRPLIVGSGTTTTVEGTLHTVPGARARDFADSFNNDAPENPPVVDPAFDDYSVNLTAGVPVTILVRSRATEAELRGRRAIAVRLYFHGAAVWDAWEPDQSWESALESPGQREIPTNPGVYEIVPSTTGTYALRVYRARRGFQEPYQLEIRTGYRPRAQG